MRAASLLTLVLAASPAAALTVFPDCGPETQTIEAAYAQFDDFADPVVMAYGTFRSGPVERDEVYGADNEFTDSDIRGHFRGKSATTAGFDATFSAPVLIAHHCISGDCTPRLDGTPYLAFLVKTSEGYAFERNDFLCAPSGFANPGQSGLNRALACLAEGCR